MKVIQIFSQSAVVWKSFDENSIELNTRSDIYWHFGWRKNELSKSMAHGQHQAWD